MFEQFPKVRPPLPKDIQDIYASSYKLNREGKTVASWLSQKLESWLHKQVAKDVLEREIRKTTLEIGAGTLNQLQYEPEVGPYDIVEPFKELYEGSPHLKRIRNAYADMKQVPGQCKYDRITSVAAFEHICNLPEVIARCGLLLKQDGMLRVSIPNEGSLLWELGWRISTGLEFRLKYGLDYGWIMRHEHVNKASEIENQLEYFFKNVKCKIFGISKSLSFYRFYCCRYPIIERCRKFSVNH